MEQMGNMKDAVMHGANMPTNDADVEATLARKNLVSEILKRVQNAKAFHKDAFDRMKSDMDLAYHGYDPKEWDKDKYVVNIVQRHVQQRTAALYAKNPRAVAKPRDRLMYTVWDGDPTTISQAKAVEEMASEQMQPVPEAVRMVLEEYEEAKAQRKQMEKIARTMEILFHYYMTDAQPMFKSQMKAMVRRVLTTSVGYVKLGFQRETERRPEVSARMNDVQVKMDHLAQIVSQLKDGKTPAPDQTAEFEELRMAMEQLTKEEDIIVREGLVFDFPDSNSIIIDPLCKQIRGFVGARWIAHAMFFSQQEYKEIYKKDPAGYIPHTVKGRSHDSSRASIADSSPTSKDVVEENMICVYQVFDKPSGMVYEVADGCTDFCKEPAAPELQIETFWPIFALLVNEVEHHKEIYPPSDVHLIRSMAAEYNRAREGLREHRVANRPTYLTPAGALEDTDKDKLKTRGAHDVLTLNGMQPGQKSEDLIAPLKTLGIDPNLYEVSTTFQDVQLAVGSQEAQFGTTGGATATENSIAESSRMSALGAQVDELDSFMSEVARCAGAILLREMSVEQVKKIAGPGAVWPTLSAAEIAGEIFLEIEAGSTGKPNQAAELRNLERVLPYIIQIPGIDPKWLAKEVLKRMDDKLDLDSALAEGQMSISAMNGAATAEGAAGMGQGPQGGMNAPVAGSPGGGPTGPSPTPGVA
jgi:adenylate kinase family enzyme